MVEKVTVSFYTNDFVYSDNESRSNEWGMDKLVIKINKLIVRISRGDSRALDELYELTSRMLLAMARKYLYDKSYAEDLISETYYKLVKNADKFDAAQNGLNWLYKIIHNEAINFNKKFLLSQNCELTDQAADTTKWVDDWLDKILIQDALKQLSGEERELIYFRYWEGQTLQEIARRRNKPLITTYDEINRILKKIKKLIK